MGLNHGGCKQGNFTLKNRNFSEANAVITGLVGWTFAKYSFNFFTVQPWSQSMCISLNLWLGVLTTSLIVDSMFLFVFLRRTLLRHLWSDLRMVDTYDWKLLRSYRCSQQLERHQNFLEAQFRNANFYGGTYALKLRRIFEWQNLFFFSFGIWIMQNFCYSSDDYRPGKNFKASDWQDVMDIFC